MNLSSLYQKKSLMTICAVLFGSTLSAQMVNIPASADVTLYEDFGSIAFPDTPEGITANGSGDYLFAGRTSDKNEYKLRRAILKFDVASAIPANATITSARLELFMSKSTIAGATDVSIHLAEKNWGEGASDAPGQEGGGTSAETNDATWVYNFFDNSSWDGLGGDYFHLPSATTSVDFIEDVYGWESIEMAAEVQDWLDNPSTNYGWFLIGDESDPFEATAKRYDSRSFNGSSNPPVLKVFYANPNTNGSDLWLLY